MMPMQRQPAPVAWADKERSYLAKLDKLTGKAALHGWQHESIKLAHWFHAEVRPRGEPTLCAYCDGRVRLTIRVLGLNERTRCNARKNRWQDLRNAAKHPLDEPRLEEMSLRGPYRFVAIYFLAFHEAQKAFIP